LKRELQFRKRVAIQRFSECLTTEQLTFLAEHGYVEETVTTPEHSKFDGLSRKALLTMWRGDERRNTIIHRGIAAPDPVFMR
jgi:hypothetical protein